MENALEKLVESQKKSHFFFVENKNNIKNTSLHCFKTTIWCPLVGGVWRGEPSKLDFLHTSFVNMGLCKDFILVLLSLPSYLGQFDTNYIIFRNVEIFKNYFFQIKKYCEENSGYFKNISFVEMNVSQLIN